MSLALQRLQGSRAVNWRTIAGLILVPLTIAGVLLWGLWNPTDRLNTVTAAVVNLDEPVTIDGQMVPMGRVLASELIAGEADTNFTWVLTDEADAAAGLENGSYATVVTIPENFSAAATSASQSAELAERAVIDINTSKNGRLLDPVLSAIVTSTATTLLNEQLGAQFVGQVFVGMTQLGEGISVAADGAGELASGAGTLAEGATGLATGTNELASGIAGLADGATALASGSTQLADGATQLATGARAAADGGAALAAGVGGYVAGVNQLLGGLQAVAPNVEAQINALRALIEADVVAPPAGMTKEEMLAGIDELLAGFTAMAGGAGELIAGGNELAAGTAASAEGQAALASGLEGYAAGAQEFAAGVPLLASGAQEAASGAAQLAAGSTEFAAGTSDFAEGTVSLADGLAVAAAEVPSYTTAESEKLAQTLVAPVAAQGGSDELFNASGVPLFAGIALWAGALASFLVLAPLWRRTQSAARGLGYITLRSVLPALTIGAIQGALAGAILPVLLGYDWNTGLAFFGVATLAGITFALVNQGLSALLGGVGRFISFALLVVAFAIGVISTAPGLLQSIGDASPIGAVFTGFQTVAAGTAGTSGAVTALVMWALGGVALTMWAVARERKRSVALA